MENITKISDRIKQFIDYKKLTINKFSDAVGTSNSYFNKLIKNGTTIGSDKIENILHAYPELNPSWLILGEGDMLRVKKYELSEVNEPSSVYGKKSNIPLVNFTAIGGFGNSNFSIQERDVKQYYVIPKFEHKHVDFMIEVEGSSMYPKYNSGDVVACRIINEQNFIQWNKTHVVATKDQGIIIKRIQKGENQSLLMVSDNKDYAAFEVPQDQIEGIALVVGVIRLE